MPYQFLHIECYSLKAGQGKVGGHAVADIVAEVTRLPDASKHVLKPQPPQLISGVDPSVLPAMCETYASTISDTFIRKNRKTGIEEKVTRKMRIDGHVLIGGVFSAPAEMPVGNWNQYRAKMIEELEHEFNERLVSVVEHHDEPYQHCHFYIIPRPGERFNQVHPGHRAAGTAKNKNLRKGLQNEEYISAMSEWQDKYWNIGLQFGLARLGPKRQRLTRPEWQAQKAELLRTAEMSKKVRLDNYLVKQTETKNIKLSQELKAEKLEISKQRKRIRSVAGIAGEAVGAILGGFTTATFLLRDILIGFKLWPGVSSSARSISDIKKSLEEKNEILNREKLKLEKERQIVNIESKKVARMRDEIQTSQSLEELLAKSKQYNIELAQENNLLNEKLRNLQPK